jgi:hypothetical protein
MKRRLLALTLAAGVAFGAPAAALADDCHNTSRAAPADPTQLVISGNWVWVPVGTFGDGEPEQAAWYFAVPGGFIANMLGLPNAGGNYTNGKTYELQGVSANCDPSKTTSRQTSNGIQNDCSALRTP